MVKNKTDYIISGAILAGGKASRIGGIAKGTLKNKNGVSIVEHLIDQLYLIGVKDVIVIANDDINYQNCGVEVIPDIRDGLGPIGGIEAAMVYFTGKSDAVMFVSCDMPNLSAHELLALKRAFIETESPIVFAETRFFLQHPLCSVVHSRLTEQISSAIDNCQRKVRNIWQQLKAVRVQFDNAAAFYNINTFTELYEWERKNRDEKTNLCGNIDNTTASRVHQKRKN